MTKHKNPISSKDFEQSKMSGCCISSFTLGLKYGSPHVFVELGNLFKYLTPVKALISVLCLYIVGGSTQYQSPHSVTYYCQITTVFLSSAITSEHNRSINAASGIAASLDAHAPHGHH